MPRPRFRLVYARVGYLEIFYKKIVTASYTHRTLLHAAPMYRLPRPSKQSSRQAGHASRRHLCLAPLQMAGGETLLLSLTATTVVAAFHGPFGWEGARQLKPGACEICQSKPRETRSRPFPSQNTGRGRPRVTACVVFNRLRPHADVPPRGDTVGRKTSRPLACPHLIICRLNKKSSGLQIAVAPTHAVARRTDLSLLIQGRQS